MSYYQGPLPKGLPTYAIPGESWACIDSTVVPYPKSTYAFVCQFWSIVYEMNDIYYSKKAASISCATRIFRKLLAWADTMQGGVERNQHNPDHVLNLQ